MEFVRFGRDGPSNMAAFLDFPVSPGMSLLPSLQARTGAANTSEATDAAQICVLSGQMGVTTLAAAVDIIFIINMPTK